MRYGTIVQFNTDKGYGFIKPDQGADVFFHVTALGEGIDKTTISTGQAVKYQLAERKASQADRGSKPADQRAEAAQVTLIDKIPGGELSEGGRHTRHPNARKRKPTWRR